MGSEAGEFLEKSSRGGAEAQSCYLKALLNFHTVWDFWELRKAVVLLLCVFVNFV